MTVRRLGHINIRTRDLDGTLSFYETVLGFVRGPASTMRDQGSNAWLYADGGLPLIHVNTAGPDEVSDYLPCALDHIAFDCDARQAMADRLTRANIDYRIIETIVPGMIQFKLIDPNGIPLELTFGYELLNGL